MEIGLVWTGLAINFLLGSLYAAVVRHGSKQGYTEGYTALLVIIGVGFTLLINQTFIYVPNNQLLDGVLSLAGFAASGAPMTFEYFMRQMSKRKAD